MNPDSFLIGYHLDLAQGFPFDQLGLNDKYGAILPSIADFGFLYDQYFIDSLKGNLWPGIRISEEAVMARAEGQNVSFSEYVAGDPRGHPGQPDGYYGAQIPGAESGAVRRNKPDEEVG